MWNSGLNGPGASGPHGTGRRAVNAAGQRLTLLAMWPQAAYGNSIGCRMAGRGASMLARAS